MSVANVTPPEVRKLCGTKGRRMWREELRGRRNNFKHGKGDSRARLDGKDKERGLGNGGLAGLAGRNKKGNG